MKRLLALGMFLACGYLAFAQSLIPNPFAYASCISFASPTGWVNCTGSPDCAASRCTVPSGCSGQAVMCFGESYYYMLAAPLTIGTNYTVAMNVSTGQLGASSIISGNHTFNVIGLTSAPTNCAAANYGSVCSTPGAVLLLSGTVNTIGWVSFTNTFTATSAIRYIVIGNCDGTGNGGNLFCNFTLTPSVVFPVELGSFDVSASGCEATAQWTLNDPDQKLSAFELVRVSEGQSEEVVATIAAESGRTDYSYTDAAAAPWLDYQLRLLYRNGGTSQSGVVHVQTSCAELPAAIEGNPVRGSEAVLRYKSTGAPMEVTLCDVSGRHMRTFMLAAAPEGWQRAHIEVADLRPGIYFLRLHDGEVVKLQISR